MTRRWVLFVLAASAASAGPAPQGEVEALVERNLAAISSRCTKPADCAVDATTIAYASNGLSWAWKPDDGAQWSDILFTGFNGTIQLAPRAGLVVADADLAWFQVPYTATLRADPDPDRVSHTPSRAGGIAVKQHDGWHLAGIAYTDLISDHELFTQAPHPDWFDPKEFSKLDVNGDAHIARDIVAGWFTSGFAAHAGPTAHLLASGSSEQELARGADALKLATKWDKLGIRPWQIDVERVAGGKLAFVSATVLLPVDKTGRSAPLVLFAVLVPDGDGWRWVSLQYGATDR